MKKRTFLGLIALTLAAAAVHIWGNGAAFPGFALALSASIFAAGIVLER